jgi:hypothetical protein
MRITFPEYLKHPVAEKTSIKMISALRDGFHLNPHLEQAICSDQKCGSIECALQQWVQGLLLCPDQQFGMLLMPMIAQRFDEYLNQIRSQQPWIQ